VSRVVFNGLLEVMNEIILIVMGGSSRCFLPRFRSLTSETESQSERSRLVVKIVEKQ
jgi:hypothetical protein